MPESLEQLLDLLGERPWLRAGALVVLAFVAAAVVDFLVTRILRVLARKTVSQADDRLLALFHRPVQVSVVLIGLSLAAHQLPLPERPAPEGAEVWTWAQMIDGLLQTIALLIWTGFAVRFIRLLLAGLSKDTQRFQVLEPTTLPLFDNLGKVAVLGGSVYLLIQIWEADATGWLASAGVVGIAIGFAAKDTLSNLFAGVFIIADAPYRLGDYIVLDSGERGAVVHIGLRSTRLQTRDDIEITIPNAVMGAAKILNETGGPSSKRRVRIPVGVAYGSDIEQVRSALQRVAKENEMVCADPAARVRFRAFGASSLDFELLCWIPQPELRGRAVDALLTAVYQTFAAEGIEIPFPQMDVHLRNQS